MEIDSVPFNHFLGVKKSKNTELSLVELGASESLLNHIGSVHASAQFALAEACSGEFLIRRFAGREAQFVPVVRRVEGKFKKPANGAIFARAAVPDDELTKFQTDLETKGRAMVPISVDVFDANNVVTMSASIEWFVQRIER